MVHSGRALEAGSAVRPHNRTIFAPVSKADPKHGRWILPLVIGGLVLFTYLFVNALPPAPVDVAATTTTTAEGGGDGGGGGGDGTTTTAASGDTEFLAVIDDYASRTASLATQAQTINDDYDSEAADFATTRDAMIELQSSTDELVAEITAQEVPDAASAAWADVITPSNALSTAAAEMLDGLVNTAGSEKRLAELANYETAAADMSTGFDAARDAVG